MRVLVVENELYMAEAIPDGLRLEAIAADLAGDSDTALELLNINVHDVAVLDRDLPGPSDDEIAKRIVASDIACRSSCSPPPTSSTTKRADSRSAPNAPAADAWDDIAAIRSGSVSTGIKVVSIRTASRSAGRRAVPRPATMTSADPLAGVAAHQLCDERPAE